MSEELPDGSPSAHNRGEWVAFEPDGRRIEDNEAPGQQAPSGPLGRLMGECMPQSVKLMSEYGAESPIWTSDGMVSPEDVGLSAPLSADLLEWQDHFERHFHHDTGWNSEPSREWYAEEAERLSQAVARELGNAVELIVSLWPLKDSSH